MNLKYFLAVCAVICFAIHGFGVPTGRLNFQSFGFMFATAAILL